MAASQSCKFLSSKLSTSLRNLIHLHHHAAAAAPAVSLTGKLPLIVNEKPKLAQNGADLILVGRLDWPTFSHQQFAVIEATDRNSRKVDSDPDEDEIDDCDSDDDIDNVRRDVYSDLDLGNSTDDDYDDDDGKGDGK